MSYNQALEEYNAGHYEKAIKFLNKIESKSPGMLIECKRLHGKCLASLGKFKDSKDKFESIFEYINANEGLISENIKAVIYNDFAKVCNDSFDYGSALYYYKKAKEIYEKDIEISDKNETLGIIYNNMGVIYKNLCRFDEAVEMYSKALDIQINEEEIARIHSNLADALKEIGQDEERINDTTNKYEEAENEYKHAISIAENICSTNSQYEMQLAKFYTNFGGLYIRIGDYKKADYEKVAEYYNKALDIINNHINKNPSLIIEKLDAKNGLACFYQKDFPQKAIEMYNEILNEAENNKNKTPDLKNHLLIIQARCLANICIIENNEENYDGVFEILAEIKKSIKNQNEYIYTFKKEFDDLIKMYLEEYNGNADKALLLIEMVRNKKYVYKKNNTDLLEKLKNFKDILLTIELTESSVIYIVSMNGENKIYKESNADFEKYCYELSNLNKKTIEPFGKRLFDAFPENVKKIFSENKEIFISLDSYIEKIPFELMRINKEGSKYDYEYAGRKYLLPRVNGIEMILNLTKEHYKCNLNDLSMLIAAPETEDLPKLESVKEEYKNISSNFIVKLYDAKTDKKKVMESIPNNLSVFHFAGHGESDKILLKNTKIYAEDFKQFEFNNSPLFFLNCCQTGTLKNVGGGFLEGFPQILLEQGAKAVISSSYSLYDKDAEQFSKEFYKNYKKQTIKETIMNIRNGKDIEPLAWGMYKFYGTPDLTFV